MNNGALSQMQSMLNLRNEYTRSAAQTLQHRNFETLITIFAGIVQRRLSNGIKVNYSYSDNEPQSVIIRVCAAGGRALEGAGPGPSGSGSVIVGTRSLSESGDHYYTHHNKGIKFGTPAANA